jgi:hypothetical protein
MSNYGNNKVKDVLMGAFVGFCLTVAISTAVILASLTIAMALGLLVNH